MVLYLLFIYSKFLPFCLKVFELLLYVYIDVQQDEMMPVETQPLEDEMEGSGNEPDVDQREPPQPSLFSRVS